jgi:thiol-disulfide isomerase/thioredoxin
MNTIMVASLSNPKPPLALKARKAISYPSCLFVIPFLLVSACGRFPQESANKTKPEPKPATLVELEIDPLTSSKIQNLSIGSSRHEVIEALGQPTGKLNLGNSETLYFHDLVIELQSNQVTRLPENLKAKLKSAHMQRQHDERAKIEKAKAQSAARANQNIRKKGEEIDIESFVGNGVVTIIDFYADWCGPCKVAEPHLLKLAEDPDVKLIQIDIVKWGTPVVQQYGIRSIPNMRVFDGNGKQVGEETGSVPKIAKYVAKAKK